MILYIYNLSVHKLPIDGLCVLKAMSAPADRKAELALKKEKLRSLREEKLKKEEIRRQGLSGTTSTPGSSADLRGEADALLKNLGIGQLEKQALHSPPVEKAPSGRR